MLQLNQPQKSTITRDFKYELPDYLAKDLKEGEKCFFKTKAKPLSDCTVAMKPVYEQLVATTKMTTLHLNRRLDAITGSQKDAFDIDNKVVADAFSAFAGDDTKALQKFMRSLTMACFEKCIESWGTNIHDNSIKGPMEPTLENLEQLVMLAYPDSGLPDVPELAKLFSDLRNDAFQGEAKEIDAIDEANKADLKNS